MIGRVAGLAAYGAGLNTLPLVGLQGIVSHMFDADVDVAALVEVISTVCMWAECGSISGHLMVNPVALLYLLGCVLTHSLTHSATV